MKVLGITCGIGSMLIGARQAGFDVIGNIEWRKYYHSGTFEHNFKKAFMVKKIEDLSKDQLEQIVGVDLIMGHTECGNYSLLNKYKSKIKDSGDIPIFIDAIKKIKPRFFTMDNLAVSLMGTSAKIYAKNLPDYDLYFEWISNYNYGNIQKFRRRLFLIGALKSEQFIFHPGEKKNNKTVQDVIGDLPLQQDIPEINHNHKKDNEIIVSGKTNNPSKCFNPYEFNPITYGKLAEYMLTLKTGSAPCYIKQDNNKTNKIGWSRIHWDQHSHTLDGGGWQGMSHQYHSITGYPLTIRERARIQGCPDTFIFYGDEEPFGVKQTGKFMPVQFCKYISQQIAAHIRKKKFKCSNQRLTNFNKYIDEAKRWYCKNIGYENQSEVCKVCWLKCTPELLREVPEAPEVAEVAEVTEVSEIPEKVAKTAKVPKSRKTIKIEINKMEIEKVQLIKEPVPENYHCDCTFCKKFLGILKRSDDTFYSKLERKKYYDIQNESSHIAKTPLHIARWAVQQFTKEGDWVLDPTIGAGTTAVEALIQKRNVSGIELEFIKSALANAKYVNCWNMKFNLRQGDARNLKKLIRQKHTLIINNPPYSGDERQKKYGEGKKAAYDRTLTKNLAFLKENKEYWDIIKNIYQQCSSLMKPGAHFVLGVKDMMRQKKPYLLHKFYGEILKDLFHYKGMVLLPHYPPTLFMSTYQKRWPEVKKIPRYQTILIFQKK